MFFIDYFKLSCLGSSSGYDTWALAPGPLTFQKYSQPHPKIRPLLPQMLKISSMEFKSFLQDLRVLKRLWLPPFRKPHFGSPNIRPLLPQMWNISFTCFQFSKSSAADPYSSRKPRRPQHPPMAMVPPFREPHLSPRRFSENLILPFIHCFHIRWKFRYGLPIFIFWRGPLLFP